MHHLLPALLYTCFHRKWTAAQTLSNGNSLIEFSDGAHTSGGQSIICICTTNPNKLADTFARNPRLFYGNPVMFILKIYLLKSSRIWMSLEKADRFHKKMIRADSGMF